MANDIDNRLQNIVIKYIAQVYNWNLSFTNNEIDVETRQFLIQLIHFLQMASFSNMSYTIHTFRNHRIFQNPLS